MDGVVCTRSEVEREEEDERKEIEFRREIDVDEERDAGMAGVGGGGSYPGCCTPSIHIESEHLSGVESLSRRNRMALSRCPFPCLAAVRRAEVCAALLGELDADCERREGRERSVVEVLKVWENQPDRRVGRSPMRDVEDAEE